MPRTTDTIGAGIVSIAYGLLTRCVSNNCLEELCFPMFLRIVYLGLLPIEYHIEMLVEMSI